MDQDKRRLRQLKKQVKRVGSKRRRRYLKRQLEENPEDARFPDFQFGRDSSASYNNLDQDQTRK